MYEQDHPVIDKLIAVVTHEKDSSSQTREPKEEKKSPASQNIDESNENKKIKEE